MVPFAWQSNKAIPISLKTLSLRFDLALVHRGWAFDINSKLARALILSYSGIQDESPPSLIHCFSSHSGHHCKGQFSFQEKTEHKAHGIFFQQGLEVAYVPPSIPWKNLVPGSIYLLGRWEMLGSGEAKWYCRRAKFTSTKCLTCKLFPDENNQGLNDSGRTVAFPLTV